MFDDSEESQFTAPQQPTPGGWQRWYWPAVALAAWLILELTASPALPAVVLCLRRGSDDFLTGMWLWSTDPTRGRGRACAWFSFARGVTRIVVMAGILTVVVVKFMEFQNWLRGAPLRQDDSQWLSACFWLMATGLPVATLLALIACASARRHSVKVWLDPGLHAARLARQWPPALFGQSNLVDLPYLVMLGVVSALVVTVAVVALALPAPQPWGIPLEEFIGLGLFLLLCVLVPVQLFRSTSGIRAQHVEECWGNETSAQDLTP
jgi:hypothetical protein